MENINAYKNVFAFGGIDGGRNALYSVLDQVHLERLYEYCDEAKKITGLDIRKQIEHKVTEDSLDVKFMDWCVTYILDCILFKMYIEKGNKPDMLLGYSLGLNTALYCAGCIEFKDGITILQGIRDCVETSYKLGNKAMGIMIGITKENVQQIITDAGYSEHVRIGSYNSEFCNVVTGDKAMIEELLIVAKEQGCLRTRLLDVPFTFHFGELTEDIEKYLAKISSIQIKQPKVPIFSVYSKEILTSTEQAKKELEINVYSTIQWKDSIDKLEKLGYKRFWDVSADATVRKISVLTDEDAKFYTYKSILK